MNRIDIRKPVAAGKFYPASAQGIRQLIEGYVPRAAEKKEVIACMLPHAGYAYSGRVAVETASRINIKDRIILLGPNHTGMGAPLSIMAKGTWQTPLGDVEIDAELAEKILSGCEYLQHDFLAHANEHSLEVELPILQYFKKGFKIVPIILLTDNLELLKKIGRAIAAAVKEEHLEDSTLFVASSDMTHYEPKGEACKKDKIAIEAMLELDEDKLAKEVLKLNITMCGFAPAVAVICAAKALGAQQAQLVKYETSAEATGDKSSVVGYAGVLLY